MSVVACPACESSFVSWTAFADHFWDNHTADNDDTDQICPSCDYPLTKENVLYHLACVTDVDPETVWTGISTGSSLCPVCGDPLTTDDVSNHVRSHGGADQKEVLGGQLTCTVCGETPQEADRFTGHLGCLVEHLSLSDNGDGTYSCPYCEHQAAHEGEVEWHIWLRHFEADGFQSSCPGCGATLSFGALKQHLLCLDDVHGPDAAQLFDLRVDDCFLCDLSVLNPQVLQRHIEGNHLSQIRDIGGTCEVCGDAIEDGQVSLHYPCLAAATDTEMSLRQQPTWRCPLCNEATGAQDSFITHLESTHNLDLFVADSCRVCGNDLTTIADHYACLEYLADATEVSDNDIQMPAVLAQQPDKVTYTATAPLPEDERTSFYRELEDFVERERQSARDEAWRRYEEIPLAQLKYREDLILDLMPLGRKSHPHYDLQFVFERPVPEYEHDPDDLATRFGIYPRQKVIVGADADLLGLPMEAEVTFVDDQTIGISPDPDQSYRDSELQSALTNNSTAYHLVDLLTPTPYDRKQEAITKVQSTSVADSVVTGDATVVEHPRDIGSFYAGELNQQQREAVGRALGDPTLCCIHGPPGTGKTRTLTAAIELAVARGDRVLACAHSNQAIDNLLTGSSTVDEPEEASLHAFVMDEREVTMARVGHHSEDPVVQRYYQGVDPAGAEIVGATTSAAAELDIDEFDLVIVDEATQADQPATFIPLLRGENLVLAGDHKQLPPFCSDETAREEDMHISLFEHFQRVYGEQVSTRLVRQYRMHEEIAAFPSTQFYNGQLEHGDDNRGWQISDLKPMVGHHIQSTERMHDETKSRYNPGEAELVAQQTRLLQMHDVDSSNIGIITAYSAQIGEIADALRNEDIEDPDRIEIDTIDSFQGAEREAIIVSFVRSNDAHASGFLAFPDEGKRRLNVALTRAKKRLVVIGDFATLGATSEHRTEDESCANVYQALYDHLRDRDSLKSHS